MAVRTFKWSAADSGGLPAWLIRRPGATAEQIPRTPVHRACAGRLGPVGGTPMHGIIYLVGLIVVILAILSFFGLR